MNISMKITILSVGLPYDIKNDDGSHTTGCSIFYLMSDGFPDKPIWENDGLLGVTPAKASMPVSFYDESKKCGIPCVADCEFVMRVSAGKQLIKPSKITLPSNVSSNVYSSGPADSDV